MPVESVTMGNFTLDLTRFANKTKLNVDTVVQKATHDIFRSVILKSPVDTGRFRANWLASVNSYGSMTLDDTDKSGTTTVSAVGAVALSAKAGGIVYLVNNLPYAQRLEYGYSKQAPAGMVRITIMEYQQYINKAVAGV